MTDISKYLPLSQRSPEDESAVSGDWRPDIAAALDQVADLLAGLTPEQWEGESLCAGWRVRDVAGHLAWRVGTPTGRMVRDAARAFRAGHRSPSRILDFLAREGAAAGPAALVARLRRIAGERAAGSGRKRVSELAEVIVHGYDIAEPLGLEIGFAPLATGAVALARTTGAPFAIGAVARHRTLVATDSDWAFGNGPRLEGTAKSLLLFLYGRSDRIPAAGA